MMIDHFGNVGIGTINPAARLQIEKELIFKLKDSKHVENCIDSMEKLE